MPIGGNPAAIAAFVTRCGSLQAQAAAYGHADALYIARGGLMDMNGNYTAGVLEGVVHYQPEIRDWLMESPDEVHANG